MSTRTSPEVVKCPNCGRRGDWFTGTYGPFCSKRCRLIDLGKWLGEEHIISEPLPSGQANELSTRKDSAPDASNEE